MGASLSGSAVKSPDANAGDARFNPWLGKIPWRRQWQASLVFLPGKSHGQRSVAGYSSEGVSKNQTEYRQKWGRDVGVYFDPSGKHLKDVSPSMVTEIYSVFWFAEVFILNFPGQIFFPVGSHLVLCPHGR